MIKNKLMTAILFSMFMFISEKVAAQVIPDHTLPVNSTVEQIGNILLIKNGTNRGNNLFHSFESFSILTGETVHFDNAFSIENIFSRITGLSPSRIDGMIQTNGNANLFLLNPNGIIFGKNASLNTGGSFLATTANKIVFADGTYFGASNSSSGLTISVPIGISFYEAIPPASISLQGEGHKLLFVPNTSDVVGSATTPIQGAGQSTEGLKVSPGKTIAFIGGNIFIDGGIITALSGKIELGGVSSGFVSFENFTLFYDQVSKFGNIVLTNKSLLDASGFVNGQINLNADNVNLYDAAVIVIVNYGEESLGSVNIRANNSVILSGVTDLATVKITDFNENTILRGITTQSLLSGKGANVNISSRNLIMQNSSYISTNTLGNGDGGDIILNIKDTFRINGKPPIERALLFTQVVALTIGQGQGGNISITSKELIIEDGGGIFLSSFGFGNNRNLNIKADQLIHVKGSFILDPVTQSFSPSVINTISLAFGQGGNITLDTPRLLIEDRGQIGSAISAFGKAGNINIESQVIEVRNGSQIYASAEKTNPLLREIFRLPEFPQGDSGSVILETNQLILNNSLLSVKNDGIGSAGELKIQALSAFLDNGAAILASTQSGQGGNLNISIQDMRLSNGSQISATANGTGNGGNIDINSTSLSLANESRISASAFKSNGGNINIGSQQLTLLSNSQIRADAILGKGGNIKISSPIFFQSENSTITASSQLGIDGTVNINTIPYNFDVTNIELPSPMTPSQIALKSCYEYAQKLSQTGQGQVQRDNNRVGRTFADLIPMGQVVSSKVLPDGRVQLLTCQDVLELKPPQN